MGNKYWYDSTILNIDNVKMVYESINPSKFNYETFCLFAGYNYTDYLNKDGTLKLGYEPVGYCEGDKTPIRPRPGSLAVMLWDDDEGRQFWCHLYPEDFDWSKVG